MTEKHLHIIAYDIPWPADYGGVVDLFYRIKALHESGVLIHLHCFVYGRKPQDELKKYCTRVYYYQRHKDALHFSLRLPFIVNSRKNPRLLANLQRDRHPVLIEGIHCSYYLPALQTDGRKVILRLHNTEFEYYRQLAFHERNPLRKLYFLHESRLLKQYEASLAAQAHIDAVSTSDVQLYEDHFDAPDVSFLPAFTAFQEVRGLPGNGCYCLYHGNLSINENETAACWLVKEVFAHLDLPLVIAGKNPGSRLQQSVEAYKNICLVANPTDEALDDMIQKAQVHVLPSFNTTGVKLKLLNALYNGRHCLVNEAGVAGSKLENICRVERDAAGFREALQELFGTPYTEAENQVRSQVLGEWYDNRENAQRLMSQFWSRETVSL